MCAVKFKPLSLGKILWIKDSLPICIMIPRATNFPSKHIVINEKSWKQILLAFYFSHSLKICVKDIKKKIVPLQYDGGKKDFEHRVAAIDQTHALKLFTIAKKRLLDINRWDGVCGPASAKFTLTDNNGTELTQVPEVNNLIKIKLPAPGTSEGNGADWVKIEAIETQKDKDDSSYESFAIRIRPSINPEKGENIAHFFNEEATNSFVIERRGNDLKASVLCRNEVPNTDTDNLIDKVRNAIVGFTALAGFSNIQWNNFVKGLLK